MSYNEHTKKKMQTGIPNNNYRDNWDLIFNKAKVLGTESKSHAGNAGRSHPKPRG
jgi:hypothetical protein